MRVIFIYILTTISLVACSQDDFVMHPLVDCGCGETIDSCINYSSEVVNVSPSYGARDGAFLIEFNDTLWQLGGWRSGVGSLNDNQYYSLDDGLTWVQDNAPFGARHTFGVAVLNDTSLFVYGNDLQNQGTDNNACWRKTYNTDWNKINSDPAFGDRWVYGHTAHKQWLYLFGGHPGGSSASPPKFDNTYRSSDGITWVELCSSCLPNGGGMLSGQVYSFRDTLYLVSPSEYKDVAANRVTNNGLFVSTDDGLSWDSVGIAPDSLFITYSNFFEFENELYLYIGSSRLVNTGAAFSNDNKLYKLNTSTYEWIRINVPDLPTSHATAINGTSNNILITSGNHFGKVIRIIKETSVCP